MVQHSRLGLLVLVGVAVALAGSALRRPAAAASGYSGPNSQWVNRLLTRTPDWQCPSSPSASDARPPRIKADRCVRDAYVAAAVLQAWAAECYTRFEQDERAEQAANDMISELKKADDLCGNEKPTFGTESCDTERIYRCRER